MTHPPETAYVMLVRVHHERHSASTQIVFHALEDATPQQRAMLDRVVAEENMCFYPHPDDFADGADPLLAYFMGLRIFEAQDIQRFKDEGHIDRNAAMVRGVWIAGDGNVPPGPVAHIVSAVCYLDNDDDTTSDSDSEMDD